MIDLCSKSGRAVDYIDSMMYVVPTGYIVFLCKQARDWQSKLKNRSRKGKEPDDAHSGTTAVIIKEACIAVVGLSRACRICQQYKSTHVE